MYGTGIELNAPIWKRPRVVVTKDNHMRAMGKVVSRETPCGPDSQCGPTEPKFGTGFAVRNFSIKRSAQSACRRSSCRENGGFDFRGDSNLKKTNVSHYVTQHRSCNKSSHGTVTTLKLQFYHWSG